jgi:hypothetical protein
VPLEISTMVSITISLSKLMIIGTNIKTNEEVAIKLVILILSHKPFADHFYLGTS